jgi:hypothetical protein
MDLYETMSKISLWKNIQDLEYPKGGRLWLAHKLVTNYVGLRQNGSLNEHTMVEAIEVDVET